MHQHHKDYSVDSNKVVEPVVQAIQSTQSDSGSEIGSEPQEANLRDPLKVLHCGP